MGDNLFTRDNPFPTVFTPTDYTIDTVLFTERWTFEFPNGYGASVVTEPPICSGGYDRYELAVTKHGRLCYDTPITTDVVPGLSPSEVAELLNEVANL